MSYCPNCGYSLQEDYIFCPDCGYKLTSNVSSSFTSNTSGNGTDQNNSTTTNNCVNQNETFFAYSYENPSHKFNTNSQFQTRQEIWCNKWVSLLLCFFFGYIGIHRFYERKIITGILYLLTLGFFGFGVFIDIIRILLKPNPYQVK